jgi:hypothetical protein
VLCVLAARRDRALLPGRDRAVLPPRSLLLSIGAGAGTGVALNVLFNEFRYGTIRNIVYLDPLTTNHIPSRQLEFAVAGWLSPTSGIAWFWPGAFVVFVLVVALAIAALVRRRPWRDWLPALVAVGTIVAMVAGLGLWFSPFGWIAYGPRLAVPLLPAALAVTLLTASPLLASAARSLLRRATDRTGDEPAHTGCGGGRGRSIRLVPLVLLAAVFTAVGWPQYGAPWSYPEAVQELVAPDATCGSIMKVIIQDGIPRYYHCASHVMWRLHPATLDDAALRGGGAVGAARGLAATASFLLVAAALTGLAAGDRRSGSATSAVPRT